MERINENNIYNVETADMRPNRSDELVDVKNLIVKNFWQSMARQNVNPDLAKQIAKHTFGYESNS